MRGFKSLNDSRSAFVQWLDMLLPPQLAEGRMLPSSFRVRDCPAPPTQLHLVLATKEMEARQHKMQPNCSRATLVWYHNIRYTVYHHIGYSGIILPKRRDEADVEWRRRSLVWPTPATGSSIFAASDTEKVEPRHVVAPGQSKA